MSSASKSVRTWPWIAGVALSGLLVVGCVDPSGERDATSQTDAASSAADTTIDTSREAATTEATPTLPVDPPAIPEPVDPSVPAAAVVTNADSAQTALTMLATVPIKGRAPKTGYDRDLFGQAWTDNVTVEYGRNGCDTRNDVLRRDLTAITVKPGSNGCAIQTGTLVDEYTGATIDFIRGADTSMTVQVDHVVALSNAWQTGAQQLDELTLRNLANDPRNLQAVDGPANQQKGDGDAATWLPSNKPYRCTYVSRQVEVKAAYGLWVTPPEHDAIARILGECGATASIRPAESAPALTPAQQPAAPAPVGMAPALASVIYANCAAVRAAGAAPIRVGDPGFSTEFDGDGDGVGCE